MSAGELALAENSSLQATVYVVPASISPRHFDALLGGKVGLSMLPVGVVEERSVTPVEVVEVHLTAAKPDFRSVLDVDAGQELRHHELLLLRVDRRQMTTVEVVAERFGILEGESDVHESIAFVLSELQPASLA